jgi:hypothetical protein
MISFRSRALLNNLKVVLSLLGAFALQRADSD